MKLEVEAGIPEAIHHPSKLNQYISNNNPLLWNRFI